MSELLQTAEGFVRVDLSRAGFRVVEGFSKEIMKNVQYASFELARRNLGNLREYQLTLGVAEKRTNMLQVNLLAVADVLPKCVVLETVDHDGKVVSRRTFKDFGFQFSNIGYAVAGVNEKPIHKLVWECHLAETFFNEVAPA